MLITFRSKAWSNITMFGDPALMLLKMMGHSGTVPGALPADEIPAALARLELALNNASGVRDAQLAPSTPGGDADTEQPVALQLRAQPLIQLLSASSRSGCDVMWSQDHPVI